MLEKKKNGNGEAEIDDEDGRGRIKETWDTLGSRDNLHPMDGREDTCGKGAPSLSSLSLLTNPIQTHSIWLPSARSKPSII